jgi:TRAP-type C4-dicarboxylate transport system substrate-binding protein
MLGARADMQPTRLLPVLAAGLLGLGGLGCGGGYSDRTGGSRQAKPAVLTLASHANDPALDEWARAVQHRTGGRVRIQVRGDRRAAEADYEAGTIADVRAGKVDLAALPARALETLGVKSLQALLTPFEIDSYALEREVLAGPVPGRLLPGVKRLGVNGVALLPGPLEKLLSITSVLLRPSDFRVLKLPVGVGRSSLAAQSFGVLGARTTDLAAKGDIFRFSALEQDVAQTVADHHQFVTAGETMPANVNFWPRIEVVVINAKVYAALSPELRGAPPAAARDALDRTIARVRHDERALLPDICNPGSFVFLTASPSDRAALRAGVAPVYAELDRDPTSRATLNSIDAMKRTVAAEPPPKCPRRPATAVGTARHVSVSGSLRQTSGGDWEGAVSSPQLGPGRLRVSPSHDRPRIRPAVNHGLPLFTMRFAGGEMRGCIVTTIAPGRDLYRWDGPGVIVRASGRLRPYAGQSLRLNGITDKSDLRLVRVGIVTDVPSGLPCDANQGI